MSIWVHMVKRSSLYSVFSIANRLASFITLPVITHAVAPSEYGAVEMVVTTFLVAEVLLTGNFADAFTYFYNAALRKGDQEGEANRVLQTSLIGSLLLGIVGLLVGFLISPQLSRLALQDVRYTRLFYIASMGLAGSVAFSVVTNYWRAVDNAAACVLLGLSRLVLQVGLCVLFVGRLGWGINGIMLSGAIPTVTCALAVLTYCFSKFGFGFDVRSFSAQLKYSYPLALSGLGILFAHYGDRYFLQREVSLSELGLYSLAYRIGMLVSVAHGPFLFYWWGAAFQVDAAGSGKAISERLLTFITLFLMGISVALSLFARPVLTVMTTSAYFGAAVFVPLLLLAYTLRAMADQLKMVFNLRARTMEHTVVSTVTLLTAAAAYATLIPRFGVWGAVIATTTTFAATFAVTLWRAQVVERHNYEWARIARIFVVSVAVVLAAKLVPAPTFALQVAIGTLGGILWLVIIWNVGIIDAPERRQMLAFLRKPLALAARS